uniref:Plastocyanin-like domain-containing protein n=1 Tax=Rhodosorus marinus TaxID=101924 RepID=A0A7S0G1I0_9RHOD|mmetsp:Transcript_13382/g.19284  ORF Transcript_13382/g.19284 Transcript_13382/m.19284 type:complete len:169 (+) Transcript_13382:1-507(+)
MPYDYFTPLAEQGLSEFSNLELNMLTAEYGQRVRVVLQNGLNFQDESEAHPFHMHGGDYWVLGRGQGIFDPEKDMEKLNFENPPLQSTTSVLPFGWTVIEFLADNPGFWLLHCHIGLHSAMGMGLVIAIAPEMIPDIPGNHHICGEVTVNKVLKRNNCEARRPIIHLE